jgi:NUMOD3 motif
MRTGCVYALAEPDTSEIRYVGKTVQAPKIRLKTHLVNARRAGEGKAADLYVYRWLRKISAPPQFIVLETLCEDELSEAEIYWIRFMRLTGARLTNLTYGGDGGSIGEETRNKIGASNKGKTLGKVASQETRDRMSVSQLARRAREKELGIAKSKCYMAMYIKDVKCEKCGLVSTKMWVKTHSCEKYLAHQAIANQPKTRKLHVYKCSECAMETSPAGMKSHQTAKKHVGYDKTGVKYVL